jgi:DNA-binding MarR family transcriptional regulator
MERLENLVGAFALTVADRLEVRRGSGMTPSDQASLVTLLAHPDRSVAWLGGVLGLTSSGATRLVDRLVGSGWVERSAGVDSRERRLRLTPSGREQAELALHERARILGEITGVLTAPERQQFELLLGKVVASSTEKLLPALQTCRLCDRKACTSDSQACPLEHTVDGADA